MPTPLVTHVVRGRQDPDRLLLLIHGKGANERGRRPARRGLRRSERPRPAGLIGMSGFFPERDGLEYDFSTAPPVFIQHGTADPTISVAYARRAVTRLGAEGVPVVYRDYPMGHEVSMESMRDAMTWLALVLAGERPSEPVPDFAAS